MIHTFTAADRTTFELEFSDTRQIDPWSSDIAVVGRLDGRSSDAANTRQLTIARAGNSDYMLEHLFAASVYQRLKAQGGEFLIASSSVPGIQGMAMWRGQYHEITTYLPYSWSLDPTRALALLAGLRFEDSPSGLIVTPEPQTGETVHVRSCMTYIQDAGFVEMAGFSVGLRNVPPWAGAAASAGEVWQFPGDGASGQAYLRLASRSAVVDLIPAPAGMAAAVTFLRGLTVASVSEGV